MEMVGDKRSPDLTTGQRPDFTTAQLEKLSTTDEPFATAMASEALVSPLSEEERVYIAAKEAEAKDLFDRKDIAAAQKVGDEIKKIKDRDREFVLVEKCAKEAVACKDMYLQALQMFKAHEWRLVQEKLYARLAEHRKNTEEENLATEVLSRKRKKSKTKQVRPPTALTLRRFMYIFFRLFTLRMCF